jgi:metal-responsive CopG/Arc/MetJ family transcriptional regulator
MRTTVTLDEDVAAAIDQLRRDKGLGLSEAVNELVRAGIQPPAHRPTFTQKTADLGMRMDVMNIGDVLDALDADDHRVSG